MLFLSCAEGEVGCPSFVEVERGGEGEGPQDGDYSVCHGTFFSNSEENDCEQRMDYLRRAA